MGQGGSQMKFSLKSLIVATAVIGATNISIAQEGQAPGAKKQSAG